MKSHIVEADLVLSQTISVSTMCTPCFLFAILILSLQSLELDYSAHNRISKYVPGTARSDVLDAIGHEVLQLGWSLAHSTLLSDAEIRNPELRRRKSAF